LGDDYYQRNRANEALAEWHLALDLDPTRHDVAEKIMNLENPGGVAPASRGAENDGDMGQRIAFTLGQAGKHYQASQLKEAELAYREILLLDPANVFAQKGLDRLHEEAYAFDTQRAFDQVTASLYEEGMRLYRKQEWERSAAKLQEAAKLNPDQPQVKKFLERSLAEAARQRDLARARQLVAKAQKAEAVQDWLTALTAWQEAAHMRPPASGAEEGVKRTGKQVESVIAAMLAQAKKNLEKGNYADALAGYEKVLALFSENADAWSGAKKARAGLDSLKKSRGNQAEAQKLYNRGVEAYRKGDLTQAVSLWESAAAADPQDAGIRDALARAKKEQGETKEKNRHLAQARYEDGLAAYQRGELDEALAAWKETLELDPEHAKARANIKRVEQEMK
jgi:tetratricopeptide (TPR) repeat protein